MLSRDQAWRDRSDSIFGQGLRWGIPASVSRLLGSCKDAGNGYPSEVKSRKPLSNHECNTRCEIDREVASFGFWVIWFQRNMKILQIALLTIGVLISARLVADEPTLSGHVEYHSADDKTTVAAFNWRKLYYDNNGTHSPAVALTEDQTKEIVKLGSEFQQIHGDKEHKDIPEDYKGAIIIFSFKPPEAKEAFTARVTEDNKADWEAIDKLRNYLDKLSAGDVENKQEKPEMATPRKPSD